VTIDMILSSRIKHMSLYRQNTDHYIGILLSIILKRGSKAL